MIAPIVPPQGTLHEILHRPTPAAGTPSPPAADLLYGVSTVGEAGRVTERYLFTALGWAPGTRLSLTVTDQRLLVAAPVAGGPVAMHDGFVRIPFRLRRRAGLVIGDRVLLLAHPSAGCLAVHPPAAVAELFTQTLRTLKEANL